MGLLHSRRTVLTGVTGGAIATAAGVGAGYRYLSHPAADGESPAPSAAPTGPPAPVTLKISSGGDPTGARRALINLWNDANPTVRAELTSTDVPARDQYQKILGDAEAKAEGKVATANEQAAADIVNIDAPWLASFVAKGLIVPAAMPAAQARSVFLGNPLSTCVYRDTLWALPFNTDAGMLYIRRRDRPPVVKETLAEVLGQPDTRFVGQLDTPTDASQESFIVNVLEHVLAADPGILDGNGMPTSYETRRWAQALTPLRDALAVPGRIIRVPAENLSVERFRGEKVDCMRNWPLAHFDLTDEGATPRDGYVLVRPLIPGVIGGQNLAVTAASRHADEAHRLVAFLTGPDAQLVLAAYGLAPTRLETYSHPPLVKVMPHLAHVRRAVDAARRRPVHPNYPELPAAVRGPLWTYLAGGELTDAFTGTLRQILA